MQAIEKIQNQSLKKTLQLPVTTGFYNTFHSIANGDRYMASKGENRILNSDVNPQCNQQQQRNDIAKDYFRTEKEE